MINTETALKKNFKVTIDKGGFDYNWGYRMYTDGSKNKRGVGAGICYMRDNIIEFIKSADLTNHPIPEGHLINLNPPTILATGPLLLGAGTLTLVGKRPRSKKQFC